MPKGETFNSKAVSFAPHHMTITNALAPDATLRLILSFLLVILISLRVSDSHNWSKKDIEIVSLNLRTSDCMKGLLYI